MEQLAGQELAGPLEEIVTACERELDDDSESIIKMCIRDSYCTLSKKSICW